MDDCPLFKYAVVLGVQFYSFLFMKAIGLTKRKKKKTTLKTNKQKTVSKQPGNSRPVESSNAFVPFVSLLQKCVKQDGDALLCG